jgi:hypothetical protein
VVVKAAENMLLHILDELEEEELKEGYRLIVELTAGFKVTREQLEKLVHWQNRNLRAYQSQRSQKNDDRPQAGRDTEGLGRHKGGFSKEGRRLGGALST